MRDRVPPLSHESLRAARRPRLDRDIHRPRAEVVGAHGVTAQHRRLADGYVVLVVGAPEFDVFERPVAAALDEQPGLLEVPRVSRDPAQLDQSGLDLGVAAEARGCRRHRTRRTPGRRPPVRSRTNRRRCLGERRPARCGPARRPPGTGGRGSTTRAPTPTPTSAAAARRGRTGCSGSRRAPALLRSARRDRGTPPPAPDPARGRAPRQEPRGTCRPPSPRTRGHAARQGARRRRPGRSWRSIPRGRARSGCDRGWHRD